MKAPSSKFQSGRSISPEISNRLKRCSDRCNKTFRKSSPAPSSPPSEAPSSLIFWTASTPPLGRKSPSSNTPLLSFHPPLAWEALGTSFVRLQHPKLGMFIPHPLLNGIEKMLNNNMQSEWIKKVPNFQLANNVRKFRPRWEIETREQFFRCLPICGGWQVSFRGCQTWLAPVQRRCPVPGCSSWVCNSHSLCSSFWLKTTQIRYM